MRSYMTIVAMLSHNQGLSVGEGNLDGASELSNLVEVGIERVSVSFRYRPDTKCICYWTVSD